MALYRLFLSSVVTRGRLIALLLLAVVPVLVGFAIRTNVFADRTTAGVEMVAGLGLALVAPVVSLVFASAVLGDPHEYGTLVYLWLRPVARWRIALAAVLAALTVAAPLIVVPLAVASVVVGAGTPLVGGTVAACSLAVVAYTGLFTWLGLRVKRALPWGLAYVLVWEGFVSRGGKGAAMLSVRVHTGTVLSRLADGPADMVRTTMLTALAIPLGAALVALSLTIWRLHRQDVA